MKSQKTVVSCALIIVSGLLTASAAMVYQVGRDTGYNSAFGMAKSISDEFVGKTAMSATFWVKGPLKAEYSNFLFGCGYGWWFEIAWTASANNRKLCFVAPDPEQTTVYSSSVGYNQVNDGNWHFIAGTVDLVAHEAKLYYDGELIATGATTADSFKTWANYLAFGGKDSLSGSNHYYNNQTRLATFAEASVWTKALTAEEVAALKTRRVVGNETGLLMSIPLDSWFGTPRGWRPGDDTMTSSFSMNKSIGYMFRVDDPTFPLPDGRYLVTPEDAIAAGTPPAADSAFMSWTTAATNLQTVLDKVRFGETIHVKPGHYYFDKEATVTNKALQIVSCDRTTGAKNRDGTLFDGKGQTRIFYSHCGNLTTGSYPTPTADRPVIIDSITFTNGYAATTSRSGCGGAVYMRAQGSTATTKDVGTLANCLFVGNAAAARGGAVALWGGYITNCVFRKNQAVSAGGAFTGVQPSTSYNRTGSTDPETVRGLCTYIHDSLFETNKVTGANGSGGAYYTSTDGNQNMYIVGCRFVGNSIPSGNGTGGGASGMYYGCVRDCTFIGNAGGSYGAALRAQSGTLVSNCLFQANGAANYGTVWIEGTTPFQFCTFRKNAGIGIYMNGSAQVQNCLFADATDASTVANLMAGSPLFRNCTFANNGGLALGMSHADNEKHPKFYNCIFAGNNGGGAQIYNPNGTVNTYGFTNCLTTVAFPTHARISEEKTVLGKPGFVDAANGDYTLRPGARARDKGTNWTTSVSAIDLAGNPRRVNREGVANAPDAIMDIGCYECQEHAPGMTLLVR